MKAIVDYVNSLGMKVGIYLTLWISTYAAYIGGSAPNKAGVAANIICRKGSV